jgi:hypothetical protein
VGAHRVPIVRLPPGTEGTEVGGCARSKANRRGGCAHEGPPSGVCYVWGGRAHLYARSPPRALGRAHAPLAAPPPPAARVARPVIAPIRTAAAVRCDPSRAPRPDAACRTPPSPAPLPLLLLVFLLLSLLRGCAAPRCGRAGARHQRQWPTLPLLLLLLRHS